VVGCRRAKAAFEADLPRALALDVSSPLARSAGDLADPRRSARPPGWGSQRLRPGSTARRAWRATARSSSSSESSARLPTRTPSADRHARRASPAGPCGARPDMTPSPEIAPVSSLGGSCFGSDTKSPRERADPGASRPRSPTAPRRIPRARKVQRLLGDHAPRRHTLPIPSQSGR